MNGAFVLDCSVTMAWFFADEATPGTDALLDHLGSGGHAMVPRHWFLEVGNTLLMGERRKRCSEPDRFSWIGRACSICFRNSFVVRS